jgi:hypothetical protein
MMRGEGVASDEGWGQVCGERPFRGYLPCKIPGSRGSDQLCGYNNIRLEVHANGRACVLNALTRGRVDDRGYRSTCSTIDSSEVLVN